MPTFKYELRESNGEITTGVVQADSLMEATNQARASGGYVLNVKPLGGAASWLERLRNVKVEFGPGLKDVYTFTNQLAVMIKAGINIRNAIAEIADQVENEKFRKIIQRIKDDVEAGRPFSEALTRYPRVFPPLYVNMVRASELSGNFAHMLERIAATLASQLETRSMIRGAMVYPAVIGLMAVSATIFLLTWVLPRFTVLFVGKEDLLPKPTVMLMAFSDFLRTYYQILLGAFFALVAGFRFGVRTPTGRLYWDRCKLKLPLFKRMFTALYITRSLQTMGELINAGVPMLDTIEITGEVSGNVVYKNMWMRVHKSVKEGSKIVDPLSSQRLLPRNVVQMISAGEESGNLGDVMAEVAGYYQRELKDTIKSVTSMIEPMMIVIMGVVIGFIAMSIILPIFKMSKVVTS
jgi:type IV pilus assembly protein PilC